MVTGKPAEGQAISAEKLGRVSLPQSVPEAELLALTAVAVAAGWAARRRRSEND
jgi:MYXO-CTERM domain-containing protein